eukprot:scaffold313694_cov94-Attheya_sp.AAC.1
MKQIKDFLGCLGKLVRLLPPAAGTTSSLLTAHINTGTGTTPQYSIKTIQRVTLPGTADDDESRNAPITCPPPPLRSITLPVISTRRASIIMRIETS